MPSFFSFLLFSGVYVSVSAELIHASADTCNLNADLAIYVHYPGVDEQQENSTEQFDVECGATLDFEDVSGVAPPEVTIDKEDKLENLEDFLHLDGNRHDQEAFFFTLVMVDPDAPTEEGNPMYYLHWLIVDNQGADFSNGHGMEIKSYTPPSPPAGSGPHRYQFFAYKQRNGKFTDTIYGIPEGGRSNFDLKNFQTMNNLSAPEVGFQFLTEKTEQ